MNSKERSNAVYEDADRTGSRDSSREKQYQNNGKIHVFGLDTWWKKLIHPLTTIEFVLIPLLMRCLKVTDELAASGSTRGLEREGARHAINHIHLGMKEYIAIIGTVIFLGSLVMLDQSAVGDIILWRV